MKALALSDTERSNACTDEAVTAEGHRLFQSRQVLIIGQTDEHLERPIHALIEPVDSFETGLRAAWRSRARAPATA